MKKTKMKTKNEILEESFGFFKRIPKIDIHRHIEGSVRPETIYELLLKEEKGIFFKSLKESMVVDGTEKNLMDFLGKLGTKFMKKVTKGKDEIVRFTFETFEDAFFDNVIYLEARICPIPHLRENLDEKDVISAAVEGFQLAKNKFGIEGGIIVSFKRDDPKEVNEKLLKVSLDFYEKGEILGFDLSGNEISFPNEMFKDFLKKIPDNLVIHAGEARGAESVLSALELEAKRIGHGIKVVESEDAVKKARDSGVLFEVNITSNLHTKSVLDIMEHPVKQFDNLELKFLLCTDDPVTSDIDLSNEYKLFTKIYGFDLYNAKNCLLKMNKNSIEHLFCERKTKSLISKKLDEISEKTEKAHLINTNPYLHQKQI